MENLEPTLSINHNWTNGFGLLAMWTFLASELAAVRVRVGVRVRVRVRVRVSVRVRVNRTCVHPSTGAPTLDNCPYADSFAAVGSVQGQIN